MISRPALLLALAVTLFATACSSGESKSHNTTTRSVASPQWANYRQACARESDACSGPADSFSGSLPANLIRPLHFPAATDAHCPATPGHFVTTLGSWAFGTRRVGVGTASIAGDLRHGRVNLARGPSGWENLKTHFFSVPAYQGPVPHQGEAPRRPRAHQVSAERPHKPRHWLCLAAKRPTARTAGGRSLLHLCEGPRLLRLAD